MIEIITKSPWSRARNILATIIWMIFNPLGMMPWWIRVPVIIVSVFFLFVWVSKEDNMDKAVGFFQSLLYRENLIAIAIFLVIRFLMGLPIESGNFEILGINIAGNLKTSFITWPTVILVTLYSWLFLLTTRESFNKVILSMSGSVFSILSSIINIAWMFLAPSVLLWICELFGLGWEIQIVFGGLFLYMSIYFLKKKSINLYDWIGVKSTLIWDSPKVDLGSKHVTHLIFRGVDIPFDVYNGMAKGFPFIRFASGEDGQGYSTALSPAVTINLPDAYAFGGIKMEMEFSFSIFIKSSYLLIEAEGVNFVKSLRKGDRDNSVISMLHALLEALSSLITPDELLVIATTNGYLKAFLEVHDRDVEFGKLSTKTQRAILKMAATASLTKEEIIDRISGNDEISKGIIEMKTDGGMVFFGGAAKGTGMQAKRVVYGDDNLRKAHELGLLEGKQVQGELADAQGTRQAVEELVSGGMNEMMAGVGTFLLKLIKEFKGK